VVLAALHPELHGLAFGIPGASSGKVKNMGRLRFPLGPQEDCNGPNGQWLGPAPSRRYARPMCGRVRLSSDVSEIKLVSSIPPHRPTPNNRAQLERGADRPAPGGYVRRCAGPPSGAEEVIE
jgi:hypothetical protein